MLTDELDLRILEVLRADARQSARSIGRQLGVAPGTINQRIAKLERARIITGYHVRVDESRLGRPLRFVVGLQMNQGGEMAVALDRLASLTQIDEILVVTGRWDLLVVGRVSDTDELNDLLTNALWQSPSFRHSETMLVLDSRSQSVPPVRIAERVLPV